MNNDGAGATQAKSGDNACVLNRASGYSKTEAAMANKTRSGHKATETNNHWKGAGSGTGGNVKGWGSKG
jgi:hypothetical protein